MSGLILVALYRECNGPARSPSSSVDGERYNPPMTESDPHESGIDDDRTSARGTDVAKGADASSGNRDEGRRRRAVYVFGFLGASILALVLAMGTCGWKLLSHFSRGSVRLRVPVLLFVVILLTIGLVGVVASEESTHSEHIVLNGTITDTEGDAIEGVELHIRDTDGQDRIKSANVLTNESGYFEISEDDAHNNRDIYAADHLTIVSADGYQSDAGIPLDDELDDEDTVTQDIELAAEATEPWDAIEAQSATFSDGSTEQTVALGEPVSVDVKVANVGEEADPTEADLSLGQIEGAVLHTENVSVPVGETENLSVEFTIEENSELHSNEFQLGAEVSGPESPVIGDTLPVADVGQLTIVEELASVAGNVSDASDQPIAGVEVQFIEVREEPSGATTSTDTGESPTEPVMIETEADGSYQTDLNKGNYSVVARAPETPERDGYIPESRVVDISGEDNTVDFTLKEPEVSIAVNTSSVRAGDDVSISGHVEHTGTSMPLFVAVNMYPEGEEDGPPITADIEIEAGENESIETEYQIRESDSVTYWAEFTITDASGNPIATSQADPIAANEEFPDDSERAIEEGFTDYRDDLGSLDTIVFDNESVTGTVTMSESPGIPEEAPDALPVDTAVLGAAYTIEVPEVHTDESANITATLPSDAFDERDDVVVLRAVPEEDGYAWEFLPTTVTENDGLHVEAATPGFSVFVIAEVPRIDPVADFSATPASPVQDQSVSLNASTSISGLPGVEIERYEWNITHEHEAVGPDSIETGDPVASTRFTETGNFSIELTVTDERGDTNTTTRTVEVSEDPADIRVEPGDSLPAALESASAGYLIALDPGTHDLSRTVNITEDDISIVGDQGAGERPLLTSTAEHPVPHYNVSTAMAVSATGVTVEGLAFDDEVFRTGIDFAVNAHRGHVENNDFGQSSHAGITVHAANDLTIHDNEFRTETRSIRTTRVETSSRPVEYAKPERLTVSNNTAIWKDDPTLHFRTFLDARSTQSATVEHNVIENAATAVTLATNARHNHIYNNTIADAHHAGVLIRGQMTILGGPVEHTTIESNTITGTQDTIDSNHGGAGDAIVVTPKTHGGDFSHARLPSDVNIIGNELLQNEGSGINVVWGERVRIAHNEILQNEGSGIDVTTRQRNLQWTWFYVYDNRIIDNEQYAMRSTVGQIANPSAFGWSHMYQQNVFSGNKYGVHHETIWIPEGQIAPTGPQPDHTNLGSAGPTNRVHAYGIEAPFLADGNYWGASDGPSGEMDGSGDPLTGDFTFQDGIDAPTYYESIEEVSEATLDHPFFIVEANESASDVDVQEGESARVAVDVTNVGAPGENTLNLTIWDESRTEQLLDSVEVTKNLSSDELTTITFDDIPTNHTFQSAVAEVMSYATHAEVEFNVSTAPAFTITDSTIAETTVAPGDTISIDTIVENEGSEGGTFDVGIFMDGTEETTDEMVVPGMATRSGSIAYTLPDDIASGTYEIAVEEAGSPVTDTDTIDEIEVVKPPEITDMSITEIDGESVELGANETVYASEEVSIEVALPSDEITAVSGVLQSLNSSYTTSEHQASVVENDRWEVTFSLSESTVPDDAVYEIDVTAENTLGVHSNATANQTIVVDRESPAISAAITDIDTENQTATTEIRASEPLASAPTLIVDTPSESGVDVTAESQDNRTWHGTLSLDGSGEYAVTANGTDRAGNSGQSTTSTNISTDLTITEDGITLTTSDGTVVVFYASSEAIEDVYAAIASNQNEYEDLDADQVGFNFLTTDLDADAAAELDRADVWLPVDTADIPDGIEPDDVAITRYNATDGAWEDPLDTTYHTEVTPGDGPYPDALTNTDTAYWNATITSFSTYGTLGSDATPPNVTSVTPVDETVFDTDESGSVAVTFEYTDNLSGINTSSVAMTASVDGESASVSDVSTTRSQATGSLDLKPGEEATVELSVEDIAGNEQNESTTFSVSDTDAGPVITALSPVNETIFDADTDEIEFEFEYEPQGWDVLPAIASTPTDFGATLYLGGDVVTDGGSVDATEQRVSYTLPITEEIGEQFLEIEILDDGEYRSNESISFTIESDTETEEGEDDPPSDGPPSDDSPSVEPPTEEPTDLPAGDTVVSLSDVVPGTQVTLVGDDDEAIHVADRVQLEALGITFSDDVGVSGDQAVGISTYDSIDSTGEAIDPLEAAVEGVTPVEYLSIYHDFEPDDFDAANLTITIPNETIASSNGTVDDVSLFRAENGTWNEYAAELVEESNGNVTYTIDLPGFSTFAIGVAEAEPDDDADDTDDDADDTDDAAPDTDDDADDTDDATPDTDDDQQPDDPDDDGMDSFLFMGILLVVLMVIAAVVLRLRK